MSVDLKKNKFLIFVSDDPSHSGAADPPARAGEGSGALQGLLQQIHHLPQGQNAERKPTQE
jgi:hypothetical protein